MKKSILLSLFTLFMIEANAQITITTADIVVPPKQILQSTDSVTSLTAGSAGISQTWNMSSLITSYVDTLSFIPYSWAPNTNFPSSNLVLQQGTQDIHVYLTNNSSSLSIQGIHATVDFGGGPITLDQVNTPSEKLATFSYTYNSGFTNNYLTKTAPFEFTLFPGVDSMRMRSAVHKVVLVDAWGSLTTPLGSYPVIRAKETKVKHDTTDVHNSSFGFWIPNAQTTADSSTSYTFWANTVGFPLVTVNMDSVGVTDIQWLNAQPIALGINESTAPVQANVYPNPAQDQINIAIDASTVSAVQIYDIMGKLVGSFPISMEVTTVNTSHYANGAYTFSVIGKDRSILTRGKFTIAK